MCAERCARGKGHIFTCALCGYPAAFRREMVTHYEQHDIVFKQQRLSFPSMEEFCAWKDAFERQEGSKFVKPRADNKLKTCRKIYFACQTNGVYQAKTRVTVGFCPARMTASIDDVSGEVEVDFHATHVGHGPTVLAAITLLFRFHKARGSLCRNRPELADSRFILILASDTQLAALRRHGSRCVCIDVCCSEPDPLQLTLLLTISGDNRALPVAFMIADLTDQAAMVLFCSVIKENLQDSVRSAVFIGDTTNAAYKAWCSAMTVPKVRLFSTWCVKREWRQKLSSLIVRTDRASNIYSHLSDLFSERVVDNFALQFKETLNMLTSDENTLDFADYLQARFVPTDKSWAPCHRQRYGLPSIVDNLLQDVIAKLGVTFFGGTKTSQKFSAVIDSFMAQTRDILGQKPPLTYTHDDVNSGLPAIKARHLASLELSDMYVHAVGNGWTVSSPDTPSVIFQVTPANAHCDCLLRCEDCDNACVHAFSCTCSDSAVRNNFCEHMHLVCTIFGGDDASLIDDVSEFTEPIEVVMGELDDTAVVEVETSDDIHGNSFMPEENVITETVVQTEAHPPIDDMIETVEYPQGDVVEIETTPHESDRSAYSDGGDRGKLSVRKSSRTPRKSRRRNVGY
ncbi:unnamed protein product [Nesidiocoris tenuis]|uniref:SWIM-type domain-containing protein n=1 Tax=Nesidiocoris tenuis TaxID=355587 RepID=A0A6H5G8W3_9HEMI|nr:unnamed protein product [Nesidiocoris tenuis]